MLFVPPFIKPPGEAIERPPVKIRAASWEEIEELGLAFSTYGFEIRQITRDFKKDLDEIKWPLFEIQEEYLAKAPEECFLALLELLTHHWKYILDRTRNISEPINIDDGFLKLREYPKLPRYSPTTTLLDSFSKGLALMRSERRLRISLSRWRVGYSRKDPVDAVLDCCSALEALFSLRNELRLRLSFSAYYTLDKSKRRAFALVYEMYGVRNKFIHGGEIPEVTFEQTRNYIEVVALILEKVIRLGRIPSSESTNNAILKRFAGT